MTDMMVDIPKHMVIPMNAAGEGPVNDDEATHEGCWCGCPHAQRPLKRKPSDFWVDL